MIPPSTISKVNMPTIISAEGKFVYGDDGKRYLDFTGANNTVILGYKSYHINIPPNFPGKSFLEDAVTERLSTYTRTSNFRYFKNGSDAISCAIRIASHYASDTLSIDSPSIGYYGYAGSHNEYARTINANGIQNLNSFQIELNDNYQACDILVIESRFIKHLSHIKKMCLPEIVIVDHIKSGILGIFETYMDPTIKFHAYGKSIANGYPISILTGEDSFMEHIKDIYYSTTFGGENIGLSAVIRTLDEFDKVKAEYMKKLIFAREFLTPWESATKDTIMFMRENGVLFNGFWQIMAAHEYSDIALLSKLISKSDHGN